MKLVKKSVRASREVEGFWLASPPQCTRSATNDNRADDVRLDQYYTRPDVAARLYRIFREHFDPDAHRMVEPSAGTGSFFGLLPAGSLGFDVDPRFPGVRTADFMDVRLGGGRPVAVVGNPPFGRNASTAVAFFNHAAGFARGIGFILPRTFRKASIVNRLDPAFHLLREQTVPRDAFLFRGRPFDVPAVFQVWERRDVPRLRLPAQTSHPDFEFVEDPLLADFAIQRVGARAGRVHRDFAMSPSSHYFLRGPVEAVMARLDLAGAAAQTAGNPSLAKAEIVRLYCEWMKRRRRA